MQRRTLLGGLAVASTIPLGAVTMRLGANKPSHKDYWKQVLEADAYRILFEEGTERAGSSPLNQEKRAGTFVCAACYLPLFKHTQKYDSGTGWPSFFDTLPDAVDTKRDFKLILPRTEYHCARCGGHQGHVFEDGPQPTGLRYCNNGLALRFVPEGDALPEARLPDGAST
ncbi:MAG: peptide-methionine (R)-S-oxide reductase MsrB [Algiphilus sp.]|uniref:peptide-methionine (R)-S-oxide reductase MsrB n=2 Tax=Algiphilus sp. TaxID=1872431 RepID=UPI0032F3711F|nr:peptide-methionine (R)-S-oxide reductase MsrB [Algiphilus acroporae]